jgi:hypothetical protein
MFGPCTGEVGPSAEACNGADDDCNGSIDEVAALGQVSCGQGECQKTVDACVSGLPQACVPGNPSAEVCGDQNDNDCDGIVDNGCNCIHVYPGGDDAIGTGAAASPLKTINAGIAKAVSAGLSPVRWPRLEAGDFLAKLFQRQSLENDGAGGTAERVVVLRHPAAIGGHRSRSFDFSFRFIHLKAA